MHQDMKICILCPVSLTFPPPLESLRGMLIAKSSGPAGFPGRAMLADLVCVLLLVVAGLWIGLPRYRLGLDLMDEGFLVTGAERVLHGEMPNRDFVSVQAPLSFYTVAAVFKIGGTSLASLRAAGLALYLLMILLTYAVARRLMRPAASLAAATPVVFVGMPFFSFVPFAWWQGTTCVLLAAFLFLEALRGRAWIGLPAGLATAAAMLLRQDQGVYLAVSLLVYALALTKIRSDEIDPAAPRRV